MFKWLFLECGLRVLMYFVVCELVIYYYYYTFKVYAFTKE